MSPGTGLTAAAGAAVCFGIQYLPVKWYAIYDGTTFQWFMCSGILLVGVLTALASGELEAHGCPLPVVFGGILWSLSNYAVLPLVKLLGIGLGFSLYHFVNLVVGYCTGRLGFFGVPKLQPKMWGDTGLALCDLGCILVLISFVAMLFIETGEEGQVGFLEVPVEGGCEPDRPREAGGTESTPRGLDRALDGPGSQGTPSAALRGPCPTCGSAASASGAVGKADPGAGGRGRGAALGLAVSEAAEAGEAGLPMPKSRVGRRLLGVLLALVAGGLAGVQSVPATLYNNDHPGGQAIAAVFPQTLGIWLGASCIYVVVSSVAKMGGSRVPHSVIRPAYYFGCIWACGFALMIIGIKELGYSVGYTLDAVGPIAVSSLLSIFVFREIQGRKHLAVYGLAFTLQLIGAVLIATFGAQGG